MAEGIPERLKRYKGVLPNVSVTRGPGDQADMAATKLLIESYTKDGVFTCPKCGATFEDPNLAVEHLADEINKSMNEISALFAPKKEGGS